MKRVGFLLSMLVAMAASAFASGTLSEKTCDNGFSSSLTLINRSQGCYDYQLNVSYDGSGQQNLSTMSIDVPCGSIGEVSNSMGWTVERLLTDADLGLYSIKIVDIQNFGGNNGAGSFTVNFSLCAEELACACDLASLSTMISYETSNGKGNGKDNPGNGKKDKKDKKDKPGKGNKKDKPGKGNDNKPEKEHGPGCIQNEYVAVAESMACNAIPTANLAAANNATAIEFCPGSTKNLQITVSENDLAPWHVVYTNGVDNFEATIDASPYSFAITEPGNYTLVSVTDANGNQGTVSGAVAANYYKAPTATLDGTLTLCANETGKLTVQLTGTAPWTISYTDGIDDHIVTTSEASYTFSATAGQYSLLSVSDANCSGTAVGTATVTTATAPTAVISGGGQICETDLATIHLDLTGTSPWIVSYTDGTDIFEKEISTPSYSFQTNQLGTYTLVSVIDAACTGTVAGSAAVSMKDPVAGAIVIDPEYCPGTTIYFGTSILDPTNQYTYQWSTTGNGTFQTNGSKARYTLVDTDTNVSFTLLVSNGCNTTKMTASTSVVDINADYTISPAPVNGQLSAGTVYNFSANIRDADIYDWRFNYVSSGSNMDIDYLIEEGQYNVTLNVKKNNCYAKAVKLFDAIPDISSTILVTNTISTTSGETEVKVIGANISEDNFYFVIYDPWGAPVYETNNLTEAQTIGWIGQDAETGVYTYVLQGRVTSGESFTKRGNILVSN